MPLQFALPVPLAGAPVPGATPGLAVPQPGGTRGQRRRGLCDTACLLPKLMHPPVFQGMLGLPRGGLVWISAFPEAAGQDS